MLTYSKIIILSMTLALCSYIFFNNLDTRPGNLNPDEADTLQTYVIARQTGNPPLWGFNWNGAPAINMYLIGWVWELSGRSFAGVRAMSGVMGILIVGVLWLLVYSSTRQLFLATGVSVALATNPWFLNFTRSAWENSWNGLPVLLITWGLYLLNTRLSYDKSLGLILSGSLLGAYFYHPGKLFAPAVIMLLVMHRIGKGFPSVKHLVTLTAIIGAATIPLIYSLTISVIRPHEYNGAHRIQTVAFSHEPDQNIGFVPHTVRNVRAFFLFETKPFLLAPNGRYIPLPAKPILLPVVVAFLAGCLYSIWPVPLVFLFYILSTVPVQIFSSQTPNAARGVHAVPLIFFISALGVYFLLNSVQSKFPSTIVFHVLHTLCICGFIIISLYQYHTYVEWIDDTQTLLLRNPGVDSEQYPIWLDDIEKNALMGKEFIPVNSWLQK